VAACNTGCSLDLLLRFMMKTYAPEIDLQRDVSIVPVSDAKSVLASMSHGAIDAAMFSPPVPQKAVKDGYAAIYIDTIRGDVPATKGMVFTGLMVTEQTVKTRRKELKALVRAVDRALKLIHSDPKRAGAAARKAMANMDDDIWNASMQQMVAATPKDPFVSVEGLRKYGDLINVGPVKYHVDYKALPVNDLVAEALKEKK
jgi:ABC-type nitrate/sulfonate/bicarbonate transport system substrate-binding protein